MSSTGQSFRVCAVCMSSEFGAKTCGLKGFLFLFCPGDVFPFLWREKEKEKERERGEREREREREKLCDLRGEREGRKRERERVSERDREREERAKRPFEAGHCFVYR